MIMNSELGVMGDQVSIKETM